MYLAKTERMVFAMINYVPFAQLAAVGLTAHMIERKIERAGHGGRVIYVRLITYVVYAGITMYQWRDLFRYAGRLLGVHVSL